MIKKSSYIFLIYLLLFNGCIEPFSFELENSNNPLVIESYISDASYADTFLYPSDGRIFTTRLSYGQSTDAPSAEVVNADVRLFSYKGDSWVYSEFNGPQQHGVYYLTDAWFKAEPGVKYKLQVTLRSNEQYESEWVELEPLTQEVGNISFELSSRFATEYRNSGEEQVVTEIQGANLQIGIPELETTDKQYYMWQYESTWIYRAGRLPSTHPYYQCYIRSDSYLSQYTLAEVNAGGYKQDLVFIDFDGNERVEHQMSVLVKQFRISEEYYNFLRELKEQSQTGGIFQAPPYNLKSNFTHVNGDKPVFGFFSVRSEKAKRTYLSIEDFSYFPTSSSRQACVSAIPPYGPDDPCDDCRRYNYGGTSTTHKPYWWNQ